MVHGFTRPLGTDRHTTPSELLEAQADLEARRRLTRILRSKSTTDVPFSPGDMVDVFVTVSYTHLTLPTTSRV